MRAHAVLDEILCVPVRYPDGSLVYESAKDYRANPAPGTWIERTKEPYPKPLPWMESKWTPFYEAKAGRKK